MHWILVMIGGEIVFECGDREEARDWIARLPKEQRYLYDAYSD